VDFSVLRQLMADVFECDPGKITLDSTPDTIRRWDSLRLLELVLAIEQQIGLEVSPDRLAEMISVPAILMVIQDAEGTG
jgi:acyl carrier protein